MAQQIRRTPPPVEEAELLDYVACYFGDEWEDPVLARQRVAGEEDQSAPGWDQGV